MSRLSTLLGTGIVSLAAFAHPAPASAYPVDCAILLCLAGGWPASAECTQARAVFIARITPWPIEPPLQIWNCPMRMRSTAPPGLERIFDISTRQPPQDRAFALSPSVPQIIADRADIDISDPAFDFVRSIRVFEISYRQSRSSDGGCSIFESMHLGSYGMQGDYIRRPGRAEDVPATSEFRLPVGCLGYAYRSVFVEWRDAQGGYGHEEVRY